MRYLQKRSPAAPASAFFSCRSSIVHSQSGYSSSGIATGSPLSLRKFRPFSGVPAGTELLINGAAFFSAAAAAASFFREAGAEGVMGALKGWAAEVDVAAGAVCEDVGLPWRGAVWVAALGEMGVALRIGAVVERKREEGERGIEGIRDRDAARRQPRQIIVGVGWAAMRVANACSWSQVAQKFTTRFGLLFFRLRLHRCTWRVRLFFN